MKVDIKDLLDSCIDEGEINMTIRTEDVDMEKIRRETMNWIKSQEHAGNSKRKKRTIAISLIAAAVLLFGSISSAAYIRHIKVNTGLNSGVSGTDTAGTTESSDGLDIWTDPSAEVVVPALPDGEDELLGFRTGYLPKLNLDEADITETPLLPEFSSSETEGTKCVARIGRGDSARAVASDKELYENSFEYLHHSTVEGLYCIEIRSLAGVERTFKMIEDSEVVKESFINGAEAVYVTSDLTQYGETDPERSTLYRILVSDESNNAFLNVSSTLGFEEIEKIIDDLVIVHTGILHPADSVDPDGGWLTG